MISASTGRRPGEIPGDPPAAVGAGLTRLRRRIRESAATALPDHAGPHAIPGRCDHHRHNARIGDPALLVGLHAWRLRYRTLLLLATALMTATGLGFAVFNLILAAVPHRGGRYVEPVEAMSAFSAAGAGDPGAPRAGPATHGRLRPPASSAADRRGWGAVCRLHRSSSRCDRRRSGCGNATMFRLWAWVRSLRPHLSQDAA